MALATEGRIAGEHVVDVIGHAIHVDRVVTMTESPHTLSVFREHWRLTLDGDDAHPWRIVSAV